MSISAICTNTPDSIDPAYLNAMTMIYLIEQRVVDTGELRGQAPLWAESRKRMGIFVREIIREMGSSGSKLDIETGFSGDLALWEGLSYGDYFGGSLVGRE